MNTSVSFNEQEQRRRRHENKARFFGDKAAVQFENTWRETSIGGNDSIQVPTVNLEIAPIKNGKAHWQNEINIQFDEDELTLACGLFCGLLPAVSFKRKGIECEFTRQNSGVYVRGWKNGHDAFQTKIRIASSCQISVFLLSRLKQFHGDKCDETLLMAALRGACALYSLPK